MSIRRLAPALASVLLLAAPGVARAQTDAATDDRAAVLAVVRQLFDGMRAGDSAAVRRVFHPAARLSSALVRNGTPEVRLDSLASFVRGVGTPHADVWDERTSGEIVHVDGPLAVVWTRYAFYAGPKFSHCGVDAFQLARTADGWKILALTDTRQRTGCPEQAGGGR